MKTESLIHNGDLEKTGGRYERIIKCNYFISYNTIINVQ